jgi:hypothetical protein
VGAGAAGCALRAAADVGGGFGADNEGVELIVFHRCE